MPCGPYNVLACGELPVTVSKAFKRVWIRDNSKDGKARAGLGAFETASPRLIEGIESWWNPPLTAEGFATLKNASFYNWTEVIDNQHQTTHTYLTQKGYFRHKCDRLLLAQNCVLEEGEDEHEGEVRIRLGPFKWYAPKRSGGATREVSGEEAAVRPWTGPAGDIEGWIGKRFADFLPLAIVDCDLRHTRDAQANILISSALAQGGLASLPDVWGVGDPPKPLYKVHFVDPSYVDEDGNRHYGIYEDPEDSGTFRPETDEEAAAYVATHRPDRVWFWEEYRGAAGFDGSGWNKRIPGRGTGAQRAEQVAQNLALEDEVLEANAESLEEWDSTPALQIAEAGIKPGIAFDAMFLAETWKVRLLERNPVEWKDPSGEWTDAGEGLLLVDSGEGEVVYTSGPLDVDDISGIAWGKQGYVYWRSAVRVVKPLPPIGGETPPQGGGE